MSPAAGVALAPLAALRPGPLVVAAVLGLAVLWRWRRLSRGNRGLGLVATLGLAVYGSGLIRLPDLEGLLRGVGETLGPYTYVLVGVIAFLETGAFVGLIAPGEVTVIFGGVIAGQGQISVVVLIGLVWACAVGGDTASFLLGRRFGRDFMLKHGPRVKITRERFEQVEGFFSRHGGKTIIFGRFLGLVRAMGPFIAGASRMRFRRFLPYDVVSAGLWSTCFCLLGYVFWRSFDQVVKLAKQGAFALGVVVALVVGGVALYRYLRVSDNRRRARSWLAAQGRRSALRPVVRLLAPVQRRVVAPLGQSLLGPSRFIRDRLTPGELGLELTTLLAVTLVGSYVFGALALDVEGDDPILLDRQAFALMGRLRMPAAVDAMALLTDIGSGVVVGVVMLAAVLWLLWRRELLEGLALLTATGLTYAAVRGFKASEARARPPDGLVEVSNLSFPSGHAAYAVGYIAIAVALARVLPSFAYRAALVVAAVVVAALVGLSRVYLHVHYLSDVIGGWALSAALFAGCGLVAMLVAFVRQNGGGS